MDNSGFIIINIVHSRMSNFPQAFRGGRPNYSNQRRNYQKPQEPVIDEAVVKQAEYEKSIANTHKNFPLLNGTRVATTKVVPDKNYINLAKTLQEKEDIRKYREDIQREQDEGRQYYYQQDNIYDSNIPRPTTIVVVGKEKREKYVELDEDGFQTVNNRKRFKEKHTLSLEELDKKWRETKVSSDEEDVEMNSYLDDNRRNKNDLY
jgi:hypothetical protein